MTGTVIGYDPGGKGKHGVAKATVQDGAIRDVTMETKSTVEDAVKFVLGSGGSLLGLGVDTLTCWATGESGLRPADRWLRTQYERVQKSVIAPNSLYGAMSVNGLALLAAVQQSFPNQDLFVTETHPKVLYYALSGECYDYGENEGEGQEQRAKSKALMNDRLSQWLGVQVAPANSHEWDAAISILPIVRGLDGSWPRDLHGLRIRDDERLVNPSGWRAHYFWPDPEKGPTLT